MRLRLILATALAALLIAAPAAGAAGKSIDRLVNEHVQALADCDADALVAGYASDATLFFPDGVIVKGRAALQDLYDGFVKPVDQEGLCGLKARPRTSWTSGRTTFVKFKVTAPFLAKPYFSTDGYVFKGNKIVAEVSTFDASKLTFKK
jgi:hypothetical protein